MITRAAIGLLLLLAAGSNAQTIPPTTRVRNCTTNGCHAPIMAHPILHGPTSINACDMCHDYKDPANHSFIIKRDGADLCTFCHVGADTQLAMVGHEPFDRGNCTGCHDPHGSTNKVMLKTDSEADLCASCHEDAIAGTHIHTPAAEGDCLSCHGAHGAEYKGLLNRKGNALCFTCHEETHDTINTATHVHEPAAKNCMECHKAHASNFQSHLIMQPEALCESCHEEVAETAHKATVKHSAVLEGKACLNCHQPHTSNYEGLLHDDPIAACLTCHTEPITLENGRTIKGVSEIAAKGAFLHGPVRKGLCTGCHQLHGSEHALLLVANYTQNFYESFNLEDYDLCFKCHAPELVLKKETTVETNFRNGSLNLHFRHVNMEKQGRTCRSCHATHASESDLHVVDTVLFGQWELPLNFKRTKTGGSCNSGCHRPATYDRIKPTEGIEQPEEPGEPEGLPEVKERDSDQANS